MRVRGLVRVRVRVRVKERMSPPPSRHVVGCRATADRAAAHRAAARRASVDRAAADRATQCPDEDRDEDVHRVDALACLRERMCRQSARMCTWRGASEGGSWAVAHLDALEKSVLSTGVNSRMMKFDATDIIVRRVQPHRSIKSAARGKAWHSTTSTKLKRRPASELIHGVNEPNPSSEALDDGLTYRQVVEDGAQAGQRLNPVPKDEHCSNSFST